MLHLLPVLSVLVVACTDDEKSGDTGSATVEPDTSADVDTADCSDSTSSELPVAVCTVDPNPVAPPFETASFDGLDSYDPCGVAIDLYAWQLVRQPLGSAVSLPDGDGSLDGFTPDLAGDYVVELIVTNADAVRSLPCSVTLSAVPSQDLWIELYWQEAGDDLDLHLLRPGGTLLTDDDCYYFNCKKGELDWGDTGDPDDNPRLDLDDVEGSGPENINLSGPESGEYTVVVYDYPTSAVEDDNAATVTVYVDGVQQWSEEKVFEGEGQYVEFCTIDWATGKVTTIE